MKTSEIDKTQKMRLDEACFIAAIIALELLVFPVSGYLGKQGGGIAMLLLMVGGAVTYMRLFGDRLRSREQTKPSLIVCAASFAISACLALGYWFIRSHLQ